MNTETLDRLYLSRTGLACLVVNAVAFGGCIVFLAIGAKSGPGFLLLIGTGLYTLAGSAGALIAKQAQRQKAEQNKD